MKQVPALDVVVCEKNAFFVSRETQKKLRNDYDDNDKYLRTHRILYNAVADELKTKYESERIKEEKKWKMYVKVKPDTPCHTPILLCTTQCCFNVISFVFVGTSRDKKERAIDCVHDLSSVAIIEL